MKRIITLITGALLLLPTFASAQDDWAQFKRYAAANEGITVQPKAVFMGDSITDGWPDKDMDFFTDNNFVGRGISGQTTSHMVVRFRQDVVDLHPKYVVILAGTNDIALNNGYIALEDVFGNIVSMCEIAKANKIKPVICSVLPCKEYRWRPEVKEAGELIVKLNAMLKDYAKKNKITYVDYHSAMKDDKDGLPKKYADDGCHPNKTGYEVMKEIILKYL